MYFLILKETFVIIITSVANFLRWRFDKANIIKSNGYASMVKPAVNRNVLRNIICTKNKNTSFDMQSRL